MSKLLTWVTDKDFNLVQRLTLKTLFAKKRERELLHTQV
jgi:hypothetical protein